MKSERLKKLEAELEDLEQWLQLGLVPKKELERHQEEIQLLQERIKEEQERLKQLKESGEVEEYVAPRRSGMPRAAYPDSHSMPDGDFGDEQSSDSGFDLGSDSYESDSSYDFGDGSDASDADTSVYDEDDTQGHSSEEDDDPFSDRNRWRRGPLEDPDEDRW